jgi:hypothetical protein
VSDHSSQSELSSPSAFVRRFVLIGGFGYYKLAREFVRFRTVDLDNFVEADGLTRHQAQGAALQEGAPAPCQLLFSSTFRNNAAARDADTGLRRPWQTSLK